ncbi:hypothetical protein ACH4A8_22955 [Streptomyces vietnamensis]|uniref:hypothetical protein n=1 Tax=Streptomyces vietnamensis TaxID=362257 RepID=UPI003798A15F
MRALIRGPRRPALRVWTRWTAGFLAFPIAGLVGHRTDLGSLGLMGAVEGVLLGVAQACALPRTARPPWLWAAATPVLWAAGWTVTTLAGVEVDARFTVFGATGALAFCALSGILLHGLLPATATGRTTGSGSLHEVDA